MKKILIKLAVITGLIVLLWLLWPAVQNNIDQSVPDQDDSQIMPDDDGTIPPDNIIATHTYENGMHRLVGSITLPTPCYKMDVSTVIAESLPEQVTLDFAVTEPSQDVICAQVLDDREFDLQFEASPNPVMRAKVNGEAVMLLIDDRAGTLAPLQP